MQLHQKMEIFQILAKKASLIYECPIKDILVLNILETGGEVILSKRPFQVEIFDLPFA